MCGRDGAHHRNAIVPTRASGEDIHCHGIAIGPIDVGDVELRSAGVTHEVRRDEDFDAVFLGVLAVFRVGARNQHAAVIHEDGFTVVETRDGCVGHDGHAVADGFGGVVEDGVEVGVVGETKAGVALVGAVGDEVGAVGEAAHTRHDALGGHAFEGPIGVGGVWGDGHAVVQGDARAGGGAAADEDLQGIVIRGDLGEDYTRAFKGVCAACVEVVDGSWGVWKVLNRLKRCPIEELGFVVVRHKDLPRWKHDQERIQVVGIGTLQVVAVKKFSTR